MPKIAIDMSNKVDKNVATAEVSDFFCFKILVNSSYIFMQNFLLKKFLSIPHKYIIYKNVYMQTI